MVRALKEMVSEVERLILILGVSTSLYSLTAGSLTYASPLYWQNTFATNATCNNQMHKLCYSWLTGEGRFAFEDVLYSITNKVLLLEKVASEFCVHVWE